MFKGLEFVTRETGNSKVSWRQESSIIDINQNEYYIAKDLSLLINRNNVAQYLSYTTKVSALETLYMFQLRIKIPLSVSSPLSL